LAKRLKLEHFNHLPSGQQCHTVAAAAAAAAALRVEMARFVALYVKDEIRIN